MDICKVCEIFSSIDPSVAKELNQIIQRRRITAEFAAASISRHLGPVGSTTVKKHRAENHV